MSTALDLLKNHQSLRRAYFSALSGSLRVTAAFVVYEAACETYGLCLRKQHVLADLGWAIAERHRQRAVENAGAA